MSDMEESKCQNSAEEEEEAHMIEQKKNDDKITRDDLEQNLEDIDKLWAAQDKWTLFSWGLK